MAVTIRPFDQLDPAVVQKNLDETAARIREDNPALDLKPGVLDDLLVYYHAVLAAQQEQNIRDYLNARSLAAVTADPTLADTDIVNDILSNFRVSRKDGTKAVGEVVVVLDRNLSVVIPAGAVFQADGRQFVTTIVFSGKAEQAQIVGEGDRLIRQLGEGRFAFNITVEASEEGAASKLKKDSLIVPLSLPSGYVTSYAASDFSDGTAAETNAELIAELQKGIAAKTSSNRVNMAAMLREIEEFSRIVSMSIVGFGNPEMLRDRHWIFPVAGGGRCDWYIRSEERIFRKGLVKTAVLVEKTDDARGIWQFAIGKDEAPGFYEVQNIRLNDGAAAEGGFTITLDSRGLDLTGDGLIPDIDTQVEGAYTRFQTTVIRFKDTLTSTTALSIGDKKDYTVEALTVPLVAEVQDRMSSRDVSNFGADVLVKAPVPCFVELNFTIHKASGDPDPDETAIKDALAALINKIGFIGQLYASQVQDIIHNFLDAAVVGTIDLFGRIRCPDSSIRYLRSSEALIVPDLPEQLISSKTVQFFISPDDIGITVVTSVPQPV